MRWWRSPSPPCLTVSTAAARLLKATSKFGAELDSLADFVSFGVAPALFVYFWIMQVVPPGSPAYAFRGVFWALALFYAMCAAFRLARFNIMIDAGPTQPYWKHFFMGLPSPGGAGLVLTPAIWQLHTEAAFFQSYWIGCAVLVLNGVLMASRFPTVSAKSMRIPRQYMVPFLLFIMFVLAMLVSQFWLTLGLIGVTYYLSLPFVGLIFLRLRRKYESRNPPAPTPLTYTPGT